MSSLREELTKLVKTISSDDNAKFFPNGYVDAILATVSKHLPEKKKDTSAKDLRAGTFQRGDDKYTAGYNTAITEMEKTLGADHE